MAQEPVQKMAAALAVLAEAEPSLDAEMRRLQALAVGFLRQGMAKAAAAVEELEAERAEGVQQVEVEVVTFGGSLVATLQVEANAAGVPGLYALLDASRDLVATQERLHGRRCEVLVGTASLLGASVERRPHLRQQLAAVFGGGSGVLTLVRRRTIPELRAFVELRPGAQTEVEGAFDAFDPPWDAKGRVTVGAAAAWLAATPEAPPGSPLAALKAAFAAAAAVPAVRRRDLALPESGHPLELRLLECWSRKPKLRFGAGWKAL